MKEIELESIGKLFPHPDIPDEWLISGDVSIPFFGGKSLKFILVLDLGNEKEFFTDANEVIKNFLEKDENFRDENSFLVFQNYAEVVDVLGEDKGSPKIICEQEVWQYIYPAEIYVERRYRGDKDVYLYIACECDWEIEHGLQIVFKRGSKITRVSSQDGHLSETDA